MSPACWSIASCKSKILKEFTHLNRVEITEEDNSFVLGIFWKQTARKCVPSTSHTFQNKFQKIFKILLLRVVIYWVQWCLVMCRLFPLSSAFSENIQQDNVYNQLVLFEEIFQDITSQSSKFTWHNDV